MPVTLSQQPALLQHRLPLLCSRAPTSREANRQASPGHGPARIALLGKGPHVHPDPHSREHLPPPCCPGAHGPSLPQQLRACTAAALGGQGWDTWAGTMTRCVTQETSALWSCFPPRRGDAAGTGKTLGTHHSVLSLSLQTGGPYLVTRALPASCVPQAGGSGHVTSPLPVSCVPQAEVPTW